MTAPGDLPDRPAPGVPGGDPADQGGDPACWAHLHDEGEGAGGARSRTTISTPLCRLLGITHPILLAPMAGVAGGRLAAAVSGAGGLGLIGGGYATDPSALRAELDVAGDARVGVGFITFALDERPHALDVALERRPAAVLLSFGDPRPYVERVHGAGAVLICQVQTVAEAAAAAAAGADVVVAQGQDAGGHGRPTRGTIGLVPAVADAIAPVPTVAAGGIADGRGLAAALLLGATGVMLGTRLFATLEALGDDAARAALVAAGGDDTVRTSVFDVVRGPAWPVGYDGRALRNRTVERWHDRPGDLEAHRDEAEAEYRAAADDDYAVKPVWAGEGVDLITSAPAAAMVIAEVVEQAADLLAEAPRRLVRTSTPPAGATSPAGPTPGA